ncbi:hydantoinase/oxoprolinase family protein [Nocardioides alcanivorans]|uniref:hydantoinase/oxoprolinase family protein n=1 Tax=Nocardioides alcanivorans TaxID=2897352 RepID=UPI001F16D2BD|nr:hydantoinase/oxoprolinase family protein [Nocardioides alcanivorans]
MTGLRVGIDVGGTHTDAAAIDGKGGVLAWHKTATTPDPFDGITTVLAQLLETIPREAIECVVLGSTHPLNAIVRRIGLTRVGALRLAAPATTSIAPFAGWPADLKDAVCGPVEVIGGGHEYDGTEIGPLDEDAVATFARSCQGVVEAIAITGVSSPANPAHELRARAIVAGILGDDALVTLGHQVGGLGLLERENSAILNSALTSVGREVVEGLDRALAGLGIEARSYLTQNDGTLLAAKDALQKPILTIASGPTNSMRGAAHLSGLKDAIVVDVGGTSTDFGLLVDGFPRASALAVDIGGVRTNYRMPDLISIALGGGTVVKAADQIGPDSVGHRLVTEALVFGGATATLTDVSVGAGRAQIGDPNLADAMSGSLVDAVSGWVDAQIATNIDRIKVARVNLPVIAVGGGAHLIADEIAGASEVLRFEHATVANAIGAAVAEAQGTIDRVFAFDESSREECLEQARTEARELAVAAGAARELVRIVELVEIPLAYMPNAATRVVVKAVGPATSAGSGPSEDQSPKK